jgi:hypothetical protein
VLERCYNAASYAREVRYHQDKPFPPLTPEQMSWARERIKAAGAP